MSATRLLSRLLRTVVSFVVFGLAIVAFYVTAFVVSTGADPAGYSPSGDFVVLSAALLVVAALLGGIPFGGPGGDERQHREGSTGFE
jgi:uncharacterized membrane protein YidH (DUF202 family)